MDQLRRVDGIDSRTRARGFSPSLFGTVTAPWQHQNLSNPQILRGRDAIPNGAAYLGECLEIFIASNEPLSSLWTPLRMVELIGR